MKNNEEKIKKRSDAKIARQTSMTKTQIIVPLSASADISSETLSIVLR
jgi:hypothetical protein